MSNITIEVDFLIGTSILDAIREARRKAIAWDVAYVKFKFNGDAISVGQRCNTVNAHNSWKERIMDDNYFVFNS